MEKLNTDGNLKVIKEEFLNTDITTELIIKDENASIEQAEIFEPNSSKFFRNKNKLTVSARIRTCQKSFKCNFCDKCFKQKHGLKLHEKKHTGEKLFQCQFCTKCYAQQCALTVHVRSHTGDAPYKCQFCSKSFAHQSVLSVGTRYM